MPADPSAGSAPSAPAEARPGEPLLAVENLTISFPDRGGQAAVVRGVSFDVAAGEFVGLVGESGSGKTMTALALLRLVPAPGKIQGGRIRLSGHDLMALSEKEMCSVRGARIGMVFQEPMTALNPVFTVGFQICEAIRAHGDLSRRQARDEAERLLELVAMPEPRRRLKDYPHQLSGGQRQRVMIAIALASQPDLLLADEPTTALDVTVQAQILELLERLRQELGLAVLLITHDLAVIAETCDRVVVMYAGDVVEEATVRALFADPAHPYTRGLLAALPRLDELGGEAGSGRLITIPGQVPEASNRPPGCTFHPRCSEVMERCREQVPPEYGIAHQRRVRCFLFDGS
ncbi:MAG: ABC transporter ATP-binding protein [bacterium]|nr:ABC transporter ATP-binding protein [bacterium]